ncbi:MAG: hypothetical protein Q7R33_01970 [Nitrosarchaeum sp.]|nr:hypothetical protein [Nitrosarchaeum sp.]
MARNPKVTFDIEFGKVDQKQIDAVKKQFSEYLRAESDDPKWINVQKKLTEAKKHQTELAKDHQTIQTKISQVEDRRLNVMQKMQDLQNDMTKNQEKSVKKDSELTKKIMDDQKKLQELKETGDLDDEKIRKNVQKLEESINEAKKKQLDYTKESTDELQKIEQDIEGTRQKDVELSKELNGLYDDRSSQIDTIKDVNDNILKSEYELHGLENERLATQAAIAEQLMKSGVEETEAVKRAKKIAMFNAKQSVFEKKSWDLLKKTRKERKLEFKQRLAEIALQKKFLRQQGVGRLETFMIGRREAKGAKKELGFGQKEKSLAGAAKGAVAGQGAGLMGLAAQLSGPLIAMAGIAGFIMTMFKFNKQIKDAQKNLFIMANAAGGAWDRIEKGQTMGIASLESYRSSLRSLWDRVGMKYEDALKNVGELTKAGIQFNKVQANNFELLVDVEHAAALAGMSFSEMASITGEWTTEFNKDTKEMMGTFVSIRHDANTANMATSRFFSGVMNASQGLAIYGDQVEDVSTAFANLTKRSRMPTKEAEQFAATLLSSVNNMSASQKILIGMSADLTSNLVKERDELEKTIKLREKDYANMSSKDKNQFDRDKSRLSDLQNLFNGQLSAANKAMRAFELARPGERVKALFEAMVKKAPNIFKEGVTLNEKVLNAIEKQPLEVESLLKSFGIGANLSQIREYLKSGGDLAGLEQKLSKEEMKKLEDTAKKNAGYIADATKPILDTLAEKIAGIVEKVYFVIVKIYDALMDFFGKDYKDSLQVSDDVIDELKKLNERRSNIKQDLAKLEKQKAKAKTPAEQDAIARQITTKEGDLTAAEKGISTLTTAGAKLADVKKQGWWGRAVGATTGKTSGVAFEARSGLVDVAYNDMKSRLTDEQKKSLDQLYYNDNLSFLNYAKMVAHTKKDNGKGLDAATALKQALDDIYPIDRRNSELYGAIKKNIFATGGFTGQGNPLDPAGLVHKREFVFDADSTRKAGAYNLQNLMSAIKMNKLSGDMPRQQYMALNSIVSALGQLTSTLSRTGAPGGGGNNVNQVTININQRDRQEIEQIIYKVLYSEKSVGA